MGPENVLGVMMPSVYSSEGSVDDSVELARNLGIQTLHAADLGHHEDLRRRRWPTPSAASRRTSPRRTSSRASAAIC